MAKVLELSDEEYEIARKAVEDTLIEFRDARIAVIRNNGLVIKERDGQTSPIIRLGIEQAIQIGLKAVVEYRERLKSADPTVCACGHPRGEHPTDSCERFSTVAGVPEE